MDKYLIKTAYSWEEEEPDIACDSFEEAWEEAKQMAVDEAETASEEYDCEIGLCFNKKEDYPALYI